MSSLFDRIKSVAGKIVLGAVHILNQGDKAVDAAAPEVQKLVSEGESVAELVPGVGPEVASVLNAGVEVFAAVKDTLDGTVAMEDTVKQQLTQLAPAGYSFVLIKQDVLADVAKLTALYEQQFDAAKQVITAAASSPTA